MSGAVDRFWLYWLIAAFATLVVLTFPALVLVGLALFIIPGVVLFITPPVFVYGSIAAFIWRGARLSSSLRLVLIAIAVATVGIGLPVAINYSKDKQVAAFQSGDIPLTQEPVLGDAIAILFAPQGVSRYEMEQIRDSKFASKAPVCSEICQRLLYNGSVRRVLVATGPDNLDDLDDARVVAAFRLERRRECPPSPAMTSSSDWQGTWPEKLYADHTNVRVRKRIAAGECLIQETAPLKDAQIVYLERKAFFAEGEFPASLSAKIYTVHRQELLRRTEAGLLPIFRATYADSSYLVVPLILSLTDANFIFGARSGFLRGFDVAKIPAIGELAPWMFGAAARMPLPLEPEPNVIDDYVCGPTDITCPKFYEP